VKAKFSIIAGFAVGVLLLYFAFRGVDFRGLLRIYATVRAVYILPFLVTGLAELVLRGARWRLLLNPSGRVRLWDTFRLETAGLALSNLLPLRLGEIARATFGAGMFGIPVLTVLATIMVERALDMLVLFLLFAAAAQLGGIGGLAGYGGIVWTLFACLVAVIAALIFSDELIAHRWFSGLFARFPRVRAVFERVAMGVKGFHSFRSGALIMLFAAGQWLLDALNCWWIGLAFGLGGVLNAYKCMALVFSGAVSAAAPGMPGYFGNLEFALTKVMYSWGVPKETGFAYASYQHILGYAMVTLLGVFFIYQMGHSLGRVWAAFSGGKKAEAAG
jgi:uncharacterized protein (TIRG00374 family)